MQTDWQIFMSISWDEKKRIDAKWVSVKPDNGAIILLFQEEPDYERPVLPTQRGKQQQTIHLDFTVTDMQAAVAHAISCGATVAPIQYSETQWIIMPDPDGHPFCLGLH